MATDPAPEVNLLDINLVGTVIAVRPYCHTDHYWQVYFDTNEAIVRVCKEAGWPAPTPSQLIKTMAGLSRAAAPACCARPARGRDRRRSGQAVVLCRPPCTPHALQFAFSFLARGDSMQFTPWDNPMGTDGFEFIEYAAPDPAAMGALFERMGFTAIARHRHKNVLLYRQGGINFIVNAEPDSFAQRFARLHGPSICAIAFRVQDARAAYERALSLGAWGYAGSAGAGRAEHPGHQGHRRQR